ncbi:MAG: type 11 methyltransferase [Mycobacterium sp.]|nr:type 11 methyltransferase [Mycobacterium sp.]
MRDNWSDRGVGWVENERIFEAVLAPFTEPVLSAAGITAGNRVLDIGCGSGALLRRATALGATAVGVDISDAMVAHARRQVPQAHVLLADAQTADLAAAGPFDRVVSRFGVMFFEDPVAAFTNIRSATVPGATLSFVCWRAAENPMFTLGTSVLAGHLGDAAPRPGAVGPLAFGDGDRARALLADAGWSDIGIDPFDGLCDYSIDGSDGVAERMAVVLTSSTGRAARAELEPRLGAEGWAALVADVRAELQRNLVDGAVRFVGRVWVVRAVNAG